MLTKPNEVMIFAAGYGKRMNELTKTLPKPLIKVGSKTLLDHSLSLLEPNMTAVVNTHYMHTLISDHLRSYPFVKVILESPDILETGGGLKNALSLFENETIFTLNSDSIFSGHSPLKILSEAWKPEIMEALLLMVPLSQTHGHNGQGDFIINKMGKIERDKANLVYAGVQILKTHHLSKQPLKKFSLNLIWDEMISEGTAYGIEYFGDWVDVGRPECIKIAEKLLNKKTYV